MKTKHVKDGFPEQRIDLLCKLASDRKAEDIVIFDMRDQVAFCDVFIVMTASSSVRLKAIVDHIQKEMKVKGFKAYHQEGYREAVWVLLDYGDIVLHVFDIDHRQYYNLEKLWGDVPQRRHVE